ncbi:MAG: thiol-disulfide oxidoreductase DCC family protein, partial [Planctomycetota bacterium]
LIREDVAGVLRFAPLQGETYRAMRGAGGEIPETIVYVRARGDEERERVYERSSAVLRAMRDIGGIWRLLSILRLIPRPIRDRAYDWIAQRRYRWFGKYDACRLPTTEERARLLP